MNIPPEIESSCPSFEELSALADREAVPQSIRKHAENCPECRKKLEELRVLAEKIVSAYPAPDKEYAEATLRKVRRTLKNKGLGPVVRPSFRPAILIRAAALVILAGAFAAYFLQEQPSSAENIAAGTVTPSAHTAAVLGQGPVSGVDVSDFSTVSFGPVDRIPAVTGEKKQQPAAIAHRVKQIWSMPAGFSKNDLEKLLAGIPGAKVRTLQKGILAVEFSTNKITLVRFVRKVRQSGCKLLSPAQPQPEQEYFEGAASDPVTYSGELIPGENKTK